MWLARQSGVRIVLAHTLPDLRRAVHGTSYQARLDLLYGEGDLFQKELRQESDTKMRRMIANLNTMDRDGGARRSAQSCAGGNRLFRRS